MYLSLVFIHVISVILSVGPYFVLFPYIKKMKTAEQTQLLHHIDTFRYVVRLSKHAGHVLVASGVLLVWMSSWQWDTPWILATTIILVSSLYFIARAFSPLLSALSEAKEEERPPLLSKLNRALIAYIGLLFLMMWFMVVKPPLW